MKLEAKNKVPMAIVNLNIVPKSPELTKEFRGYHCKAIEDAIL